MTAWVWVREDVVLAMHDAQLAEHGGLDGVRDLNAVKAALERPAMRELYGEPAPDAAELAAAYCHGLASCHGFSDGNKRTAWLAARLFLRLNGATLAFEPAEAITVVLAVAAGTMPEAALAAWFRARL
ncbi:type II toxin-antitoxin system death-on-curing family toxin [Massilia glaciei]|uniref:Type II toxin-antitoxin system death-on-curing family toxin n=1 Tax=Massilia glaciei TaxID=1524097 RepID=A0A2U2I612_9BURK|nr:type II toxin-antitoxin system death-on-curing family toxin [Massilia glaciei]PWF55201.1 type II toxin-antitoxin system death-on-curing family toxin [Massilia glaciei]